MKRLLAVLLPLCLLLCACASQSAAPARSEPTPLPAASPAAEEPWPAVPVYVDGLLRLRGYAVDGLLFLCPADLCALFGIEAETEIRESGCRLSIPFWDLLIQTGEDVCLVDGRYLYCPEGYRVVGERFCLPADAVERLFGLQIDFDGQKAEADTSRRQLLRGGEDYYTTHFPADDLFWLSQIIYSEARWESREGQIGVGNVVLNRVADAHFPDSIMSVVLEDQPTFQFSPVETGEVMEPPDERAMISTYLVLEGYNTAGDSLYFVNPDRGDGTWFDETLTPTVTIGRHHFYR